MTTSALKPFNTDFIADFVSGDIKSYLLRVITPGIGSISVKCPQQKAQSLVKSVKE
jgi:hypothetical protein